MLIVTMAPKGSINTKTLPVSVVIPVFNRQQVIERTIDSVLAQNWPDFEIVLVDDGSDPPLRLPDKYQGETKLRIVKHPHNMGAGPARNTGVANARHDIIAFLDSDDVWRPDKLRSQIETFLTLTARPNSTNIAVACGFELRSAVRESKKDLIPIPSDRVVDFAGGCWFCPGSTIMLSRETFENVGGYDPELCRLEDLDWFLRFALGGGRLEVVEEIMVDIAPGPKPTPDTVQDAAATLERKYIDTNGDVPTGLTDREKNQLHAYLALELAASCIAHKRPIKGMMHLLKSFVRVPRYQLHLQDFWREVQANLRH